MADANVLVLGSDAFAKDVCASINRFKMGNGALVDKPIGKVGTALVEATAAISAFKDLNKIDVVILTSSKATSENDRQVYNQLREWKKKLVVISVGPQDFATKDNISVPEHGYLTGEGLWALDRKITGGRTRELKPGTSKYWIPAVVLLLFVLVLWVDKSANPDLITKKFDFSKQVRVFVEIPRTVAVAEKKDTVRVSAENNGEEPLSVEIILKSEYITYSKDGQNSFGFEDLAAEIRKDIDGITYKVQDTEQSQLTTIVRVKVGNGAPEEKTFVVQTRPPLIDAIKDYTGQGNIVMALVSVLTLAWKVVEELRRRRAK